MNFILHHWILAVVLIVLGALISAGSAVLEAWLDVRNRPTEPMTHCHVHGPFRSKYAIKLFPGLGTNVEVCPICYYDKVFKAGDANGQSVSNDASRPQ